MKGCPYTARMSRRVVITGLGPISGLGLGMESLWPAMLAGTSAIGPVQAFDASGLASGLASEVPAYKLRDHVPKSYRKATKVMARDIELAVIAADLAAADARLTTPGSSDASDAESSYPSPRVGCHIGSGLIAADLDELTAAMATAQIPAALEGQGPQLDLKAWGHTGMQQLTPLWLLKYLPNMLACHVTIIHDAQGPSNTITCAEASAALSVGESLRVIQRDDADCCFCGGAESKINPQAFYRQVLTGRLAPGHDAGPTAVKPFDQHAAGTVVGEGGGILILEARDTFLARQSERSAYAEVVGFGAAQAVHRASANREPDPEGRSIELAARAALRDAAISPDQLDVVFAFGSGYAPMDASEAAGLHRLLGDRLSKLPVLSTKPQLGNTQAGSAGLDLAIAAKSLAEQTLPPTLNRESPIDHLQAKPDGAATLEHVLVLAPGFGGQTAALVLKRIDV